MTVSKAASNAVAPAAKGDLVIGSGTNASTVLGVGTNNHVLTADSAVTGGIKWAAPASGGMTLLASGTLGVGGVNLTSISGSYEELKLVISDIDYSSANDAKFTFNSDTGSNYYGYFAVQSGAGSTQNFKNAISYVYANYNDMATTANGATIILTLPNYSNTTGYKALDVQTVMVANNGNNETFRFWGMWKNESAITSINFGSNGGNVLDAAGTYELWGIK